MSKCRISLWGGIAPFHTVIVHAKSTEKQEKDGQDDCADVEINFGTQKRDTDCYVLILFYVLLRDAEA